jgi:hypothetical protein
VIRSVMSTVGFRLFSLTGLWHASYFKQAHSSRVRTLRYQTHRQWRTVEVTLEVAPVYCDKIHERALIESEDSYDRQTAPMQPNDSIGSHWGLLENSEDVFPFRKTGCNRSRDYKVLGPPSHGAELHCTASSTPGEGAKTSRRS